MTAAINEEFRINGNIRCITVFPGTIETETVKNLNYPGISPKIGIDPVLQPDDVADAIVNVLKMSDVTNIEDLSISPKKSSTYH